MAGWRSWRRYFRDQRPATSDQLSAIRHACNTLELYTDFPYDETVILIVQWSYAKRVLIDDHRPAGADSLEALVTGWDGALIVADDYKLESLSRLLTGPLSVRLGVVSSVSVTPRQLSLQLARLAAAAGRLPPVRVAVSLSVASKLAGIREDWRGVIYAALRDPASWPVKRLVATCNTHRRTLERTLTDNGLPGPAKLLKGTKT